LVLALSEICYIDCTKTRFSLYAECVIKFYYSTISPHFSTIVHMRTTSSTLISRSVCTCVSSLLSSKGKTFYFVCALARKGEKLRDFWHQKKERKFFQSLEKNEIKYKAQRVQKGITKKQTPILMKSRRRRRERKNSRVSEQPENGMRVERNLQWTKFFYERLFCFFFHHLRRLI
jgi:hypothetical protein